MGQHDASKTHDTEYEEHPPSLLNLHIRRPRLVLCRIRKERLRLLLREEDRLLPDGEVQRRIVHERDFVERLRALPCITIGPVLREVVPHLRRGELRVAVGWVRGAPDDLALASGGEPGGFNHGDLEEGEYRID